MPNIDQVSQDGAPEVLTVAGIIDDSTIVYLSTSPRGFADLTRNAVTLVNPATKEYARAADGEEVDGELLLVEEDGACTVVVGGVRTFYAGDGDDALNGKIVGADDASAAPGRVRQVGALTDPVADTEGLEILSARHRIVEGASDNAAVKVQLIA